MELEDPHYFACMKFAADKASLAKDFTYPAKITSKRALYYAASPYKGRYS